MTALTEILEEASELTCVCGDSEKSKEKGCVRTNGARSSRGSSLALLGVGQKKNLHWSPQLIQPGTHGRGDCWVKFQFWVGISTFNLMRREREEASEKRAGALLKRGLRGVHVPPPGACANIF